MFLKIYLLALCINAGFFIMDSSASAFGWPSVAIEMSQQQLGNFTTADSNNRTTIIGNITYPRNNTNNAVFDWFDQSTERIFYTGEVFYHFLGGGYILNVVDNAAKGLGFSWPTGLRTGIEPIIAFLQLIYLGYMILGRSASSLT